MFVNVSSRDAGNSHHSSVKSDNNSLSYPSRTIVHPKLEMTEPGDADEQEADAAAHDVMSGKVFRKFSGGGAGGGMAVSSQMESQLNQLQGGGQRMPDGLRDMMERGFERDFSQVRLHTDGEAVGLSSSIHAKAFTHGNDIYFNQGQYAPETAEGQRLVAHELAHVAQGGGKVGRTEGDNTAISVNDRVRRSEVMSNLRYCELRAESLIDDVKERKEMDSSLWGWLSNIGDDEFDADYLIDTLRMCRSKLRDLRKCKNSIDEISRGVNEILRVIRMVESALAARRNNSIEGANKWVSGLRYTRDACFTTVGIIASVAVPATAAAAVSLKVVNAGMNIVDTVEDAKSLYENVQSGNVLGAIVDGASVVSDVVGFGGLKNAKNIGRGVDAAQSAGKGSKAVKDVKKADTVQSVGSGRNAAKDQGKKVDTATRGGSESKAAKGQGTEVSTTPEGSNAAKGQGTEVSTTPEGSNATKGQGTEVSTTPEGSNAAKGQGGGKRKPNTTYVRGDSKYQTDELGRVVKAEAKVKVEGIPPRKNTSHMKVEDRMEDDDRGHIIAHMLGGVDDEINLVAQNAHLNRSEYRKMEEAAKRAKKELSKAGSNKDVYLTVEIIYPDNNTRRPESLIVLVEVQDDPTPIVWKKFLNREKDNTIDLLECL